MFLTPYLKKGQSTMARTLAKVTGPAGDMAKSYAGYIMVNRPECESNLFFWYFPATVRIPLLVLAVVANISVAVNVSTVGILCAVECAVTATEMLTPFVLIPLPVQEPESTGRDGALAPGWPGRLLHVWALR